MSVLLVALKLRWRFEVLICFCESTAAFVIKSKGFNATLLIVTSFCVQTSVYTNFSLALGTFYI